MLDRWDLLPFLAQRPLAGCNLGFCWWPLGLWRRWRPPRRLLAGTEAVFGEQHRQLNVGKNERSDEQNGPATNNAVKGKAEEPTIRVLSKRLNVFTKKRRAIEKLEQLEKEGNILNIEERAKIETKGKVAAIIKELELNINLVVEAIAQNSEVPSSSAAAEESGLMHKINGIAESPLSSAAVEESGLVHKRNGISERPSSLASAEESRLVNKINDTTAAESGVVPNTKDATANGSELVHRTNPAKNIDAGASNASNLLVAQGESRENIEHFCYTFLKEFTMQGDTKAFYDGEAMSLVGRGCLCVQYSHLCEWDKRFAMKICNDYERLKPTIIRAAKRFANEVLEAAIKALPPKEAHALKVKLEDLNLILVGKPMRHETLTEFLQLPKELSLPVEVHSHDDNPMYTPASIGSSLLTSTLEDIVSKHLEGWSYNGNFGTANVEVYDGSRYVISAPLCKYDLWSQELAEASAKDFNSCSESIIPLLKTDNKYPPYMSELKTTLSSVPIHVLLDKAELKAFHKFILDHMANKPPPVRAALICAIHNACKSFDRKDHPDAPFEASIHECEVKNAPLGLWTDTIKTSGNALLNKVLHFRLKQGILVKCSYEQHYESMTKYLRILHEHGSDYTKKKKRKKKKRTKGKGQDQRNGQQSSLNQQTGQNQQQTGPNQQGNWNWHRNQIQERHQSQQTGPNQQQTGPNQQQTGPNQQGNWNWHKNQNQERHQSRQTSQNQQQTAQNQQGRNQIQERHQSRQTDQNQQGNWNCRRNQNQERHQNRQTGQNQQGNLNWHRNQNQERHQSQQMGLNQQQTGHGQNQQGNLNWHRNQNQERHQSQQMGLNQQQIGQNQQGNLNWHRNQNQVRHQSRQMGQNQQQTGQNQNAASSSELDYEPQVQHLKVLDELEMLGAHYLAPYVLEMIYSLLKDDAMKGMLEPIWRAYRSGKILSEGESMVDDHRTISCAPVN